MVSRHANVIIVRLRSWIITEVHRWIPESPNLTASSTEQNNAKKYTKTQNISCRRILGGVFSTPRNDLLFTCVIIFVPLLSLKECPLHGEEKRNWLSYNTIPTRSNYDKTIAPYKHCISKHDKRTWDVVLRSSKIRPHQVSYVDVSLLIRVKTVWGEYICFPTIGAKYNGPLAALNRYIAGVAYD